MVYIFDTVTLSIIFKHYYFERFPTFWNNFNNLIKSGEIISVREVKKEIEEKKWDESLENWIKKNSKFL